MKVDLVMSKAVGGCLASDSLNEAARIMWERDCGIVPIVENRERRRLVGVVTDRDICVAAYTKGRALEAIPIAEVMAKRVVSCRASDELHAAEAAMRQAQVHRLPVTDRAEHPGRVPWLADIRGATAPGRRPGGAPCEVGRAPGV